MPTKSPAKKRSKKPVKVVAKKKTTPKTRAAKTLAGSSKRSSMKSVSAKSVSIVETSPVNWSHGRNGPTYEQVQIAAYHRWLQSGGSDFDNWISAEGKLRGKKES